VSDGEGGDDLDEFAEAAREYEREEEAEVIVSEKNVGDAETEELAEAFPARRRRWAIP
jgi:hypothetical protein